MGGIGKQSVGWGHLRTPREQLPNNPAPGHPHACLMPRRRDGAVFILQRAPSHDGPLPLIVLPQWTQNFVLAGTLLPQWLHLGCAAAASRFPHWLQNALPGGFWKPQAQTGLRRSGCLMPTRAG